MFGSSPEVVSVPDVDENADPEPDGEPGEVVEDEANESSLDVEEQWGDLQAFVARCEAEQVELYGLDPADPNTYWQRRRDIERAQPGGREEVLARFGIPNIEAWQQVSRYFEAKWSRFEQSPAGGSKIVVDERFAKARDRQ